MRERSAEYLTDSNKMVADDSKCVNCHRCVALCPTRALKIVKTDHTFKENANWSGKSITEIYKQAETEASCCQAWGTLKTIPCILTNYC